MKIAELFAELGFKTESSDKTKLRDFANVLGDLNLASLAAAAGLGVAGAAIITLSEEASKYAIGLENFSTITGLSTDKIQAWEKAVERAGGTTDDFRSSLKAIQRLMTEIQLGSNTGNTAMAVFGINVTDDAETVLRKMAKTLKEDASPALKSFLVSQLGVTEGMQKFLQTTDDINGALKDSPILSTSEVKELADLWKALTTSMQELKQTGYDIAEFFGPGLKLVLSLLNDVLLIIQLINKGWRELFGLADEGIGWALGQAGHALGIPSPAAQSGGNNTTLAPVFHITGTDDVLGVAKKVEDVLRKLLNDAAYQDQAGST